jgi:phosphate/sulfate permease
MGIFLGWILFSFVAGAIGSDRTIGFWGAFLLSLILSPVIGGIVALASTKKSTIEFQKRMLAAQEGKAGKESFERNQTNLADELAKLERQYIDGKITVYDYEAQKDSLVKRFRQ